MSGPILKERKPFSRLPTLVTPVHYELTIQPDLVKFVFEGSVKITVNINQATKEVVLNAAELVVDKSGSNLVYSSDGHQCKGE